MKNRYSLESETYKYDVENQYLLLIYIIFRSERILNRSICSPYLRKTKTISHVHVSRLRVPTSAGAFKLLLRYYVGVYVYTVYMAVLCSAVESYILTKTREKRINKRVRFTSRRTIIVCRTADRYVFGCGARYKYVIKNTVG